MELGMKGVKSVHEDVEEQTPKKRQKGGIRTMPFILGEFKFPKHCNKIREKCTYTSKDHKHQRIYCSKGGGKKKSSSVTMSDMMGMSEMTNKKITILQQMRLVIGLREWVSMQT